MIDTLRRHEKAALRRPLPYGIGVANGLDDCDYAVATLHRAENVDGDKFEAALACLTVVAERIPVVFPIHPRTMARLKEKYSGMTQWNGFINLPPLGYLDFINLIACAKLVVTDSGGVQEETTALGVPCVTLRSQTERPATIADGTNYLAGLDPNNVRAALNLIERGEWKQHRGPDNWDGHAAERIADILMESK
jgi:UDP-N-acetylglucosamine 2-epimerase (non-hydrolysing)